MVRKFFHRYTDKIVSKWVILLLDMAFVVGSFVLAYLLRFNFELYRMLSHPVMEHLGIIGICYLAGVFLFRPYSGIIRHTSVRDMEHILKATTLGTALGILVALGSDLEILPSNWRIPLSILIIHFISVTFLMAATRIFIRAFYKAIIRKQGNSIRVVIYGAGLSGRITKQALEQDRERRYQVVAFVDDNLSKQNKRYEGSPVLAPDRLNKDWIESNRIREIILAMQEISPVQKQALLDRFLAWDVTLRNIPSSHKWINGEFSNRQIGQVQIEGLLGREPIQLDHTNVRKQIEGKVVMVTGAAGSIGSEIVRQVLYYNPARVVVLDQAETPMHNLLLSLEEEFHGYGMPLVSFVADVRDALRIEEIYKKHRPVVIYHAAAYKHVPLMETNPYEATMVNVFGTNTMAKLAQKYGTEQFVLVSTDKAVNPASVMGATKRLAEMCCQHLQSKSGNTQFITTRFGNVLGSNGSVVPRFRQQIQEGGPVTVTHKEITRYFMTIPEACELVLEAGAMGQGGEIYVFDMGVPVKIIDLARKMVRLSGFTENQVPITVTGLRPGEKLFEEVLGSEETSTTTHHPKIRIAEGSDSIPDDFETALVKLKTYVRPDSAISLVSLMRELVPEFKSVNPAYDNLGDTMKTG